MCAHNLTGHRIGVVHAARGNELNKCGSRLRIIHCIHSDFYGKMRLESIDLFFVGLTCDNISM